MMFQGLPQVKKKLKAWTKKNRLPRSSYDVPGPAPVFPVFFVFRLSLLCYLLTNLSILCYFIFLPKLTLSFY